MLIDPRTPRLVYRFRAFRDSLSEWNPQQHEWDEARAIERAIAKLDNLLYESARIDALLAIRRDDPAIVLDAVMQFRAALTAAQEHES